MSALAPGSASPSGTVEVQASGVNLRFEAGITVEIRFLRGRMEPLEAGKPVTFDDTRSFDVEASYARVAVSTATLATLLNRYAFAYDGSPLKNLRVEIHNGRLRVEGKMHKGVEMPFALEGRPEPDANGNIRIHPDKLTSAHLPVKGLLHLFGEDLAKLVNTNEARGVRVEGDDVILFPSRLLPPPHILGRVTRVDLEADRLVETFGDQRAMHRLPLPRAAKNYIYHRGGILRFGKLTMTDADLELVDMNPKDPFDFFLADYNRQLVAGYSKNTASHGLIVYMPDYAAVRRK